MHENPENKPRTTKLRDRIPARFRRLSDLRVLIFVAVFAAIGVGYLLVTHAEPGASATISSPAYGVWYKNSAQVTTHVYFSCPDGNYIAQTTNYNITEPGVHSYVVTENENGYLDIGVDGQPATSLPGSSVPCDVGDSLDYSITALWSGTVGIDNAPPSVGFSSSSSSTQGSSVTVTGQATDAGSGVASVTVNGTPATLSGNTFIATVPLAMGGNSLVATATDHVGYTARSGTITVTRVAPPAPPPASHSGSSSSSSSSSKSHASTSTSTSTSSGSGSSTTASTTPDTSSDTSGATTDQTAEDTSDNSVATSSQPNVPNNSSATLTSYDGLVKVTFPAGAFGTDAYCTVDATDTGSTPVKSAKLIGPYAIDCTDANGQSLTALKKDASVTITTPSASAKYLAYANSGKQWSQASSTSGSRSVNFKLAKAETFAAAPGKSSISGTIILNIIGILVLVVILGGGGFLLHLRNKQYVSNNLNNV